MKRVTRLIPCFAGVLCVALAGAAGFAAEAYHVTVSPPAKVGDKYHYVARTTEKMSSVINRVGQDPINQNRETVTELDGTVEVLAVDSKGSETKLQCTVNHLQHSQGADKTDVVPPGSVLTMESVILPGNDAKAGTQFTLKDGTLTNEQTTAIGNVIAAKIPEAPTDQEILGTEEPQPIGGAWALNTERGVTFMSKMGVTADPKALSGKSQLVDIQKYADVDCYHVTATLVADKFSVQMPPTVTVEKASLNAKFSLLLPTHPSVVRKSSAMTHVQMSVKGTNPQLGEFSQENVVDSDQEIAIDLGK
jgi:hypothetical protein